MFGYPWCRDLSFDEFCEKVLPYRIGNEQAEDWMPAYREFLAGTIRSLEEAGADRYTAAKALKDTLRGMDYEVIDETTMKLELRPSDYLRAAGGACPRSPALPPMRCGAWDCRRLRLHHPVGQQKSDP